LIPFQQGFTSVCHSENNGTKPTSDYELPPLPYDYNALEPHISEQVLTWHHDTHHQGYVNGWNRSEETLAAHGPSA
jgi:hypothetical protein